MKFRPGIFGNFVLTFLLLYFSGLITWIFTHWFLQSNGFALEPVRARISFLHAHSLVGLYFMVLFGFLLAVHLAPGWRRHQKRLSGSVLTTSFIVLLITVPGMFYLLNETAKLWTVNVHTYLGIALPAVLLMHYFSRKT